MKIAMDSENDGGEIVPEGPQGPMPRIIAGIGMGAGNALVPVPAVPCATGDCGG